MTGVMVAEAANDIGDAISESNDIDNESTLSGSEKFYSATDDLTAAYSDYNQYDQYVDEFEFDPSLHDKIARLRDDLKNLRKQFSSGAKSTIKNNFITTLIIIFLMKLLI